jgi:hypothetical protein
MMRPCPRRLIQPAAIVLLAALASIGVTAGREAATTSTQAAPTQGVPADLKPLLAAPVSEMRLVVTRYTADRNTLSGNYAVQGGGRGGGRGGGGRAGGAPDPAAPPPAGPVPLSPGRLARLKRYDMDWQAALSKIDAAKLSPLARPDLESLKATIAANLTQIEADALTMAQVLPALPFASELVTLVEARIRVQEINAQKAAGTLMQVIGEIAAAKTALETNAAAAPKLNKALATRAADGSTQLRAAITEWFNFYNGYDPLFTWWMGVPFKKVDAALQDYATFLRETVAAADAQTPAAPASVPPVTPSPAEKFASVPDLAEILALQQDELRDIVGRFNAGRQSGQGRGGRGGAQAEPATPPAPPPDNAFYQAWLAALTSLPFDKLSRNAQVDYLFIKRTAETEIKRAGAVIPPGPPHKKDRSGIDGTPRGRAGLIQDLSNNMIPYTPEQLIALGDREFEWCLAEMKKASRALGFGDDWKKAVEHVKNTFVPPGDQPRMIMGLLDEAVGYLRANDLITVPAVAAESMHMTMMSAQAQLTSPFFLGGVGGIIVSYPTDTMEYDARMQSMRGNNPGFSHATAFHEVIPGHMLTGYLGQRYGDYRPTLSSGGPFYGEGWPLYWELTMYELGFHKTPEQKIGALFWRMHRCARIVFSLNYHMGSWGPQDAIDFLVNEVGHERDNATAEVRRSFESAQYRNQPLYQAAYLLGGLQLRGLRKQLVDTKIMTNKQFHDEIMRQGNMPMALIRLAVTREKLTPDMDLSWKFYGELPDK